MTKKITLKELLELVTVEQNADGRWCIINVFGNVRGNVSGNVWGNVNGNVWGDVNGTINGREWQFAETPKDKLKRLIEEKGDEELLEAFSQLEYN